MVNMKTPITVYWANARTVFTDGYDTSFFYSEPNTLFSDLVKSKSDTSPNNSYFACPAVANKFKKTYVFNFPVDAKYRFDSSSDTPVENITENFIRAENIRGSSVSFGPTLAFNLSYIFFAEESLDVCFTPPMFHKPKYTQYGSIIPGQFDVGNWFRPYNAEIQTWSNSGDIVFEKDEPLFYAEFMTDRPIVLKRFNMTQELTAYYESCVNTTSFFGRGISLPERYNMFKKVNMRDKVLKAIKDNIIYPTIHG